MKTVIAIICMSSLFVLIVSDSSDNYSKPNAFHMGVKHRPADCPVQTRKGDLIHVHYTVSNKQWNINALALQSIAKRL